MNMKYMLVLLVDLLFPVLLRLPQEGCAILLCPPGLLLHHCRTLRML